jgi:hypothetical protein
METDLIKVLDQYKAAWVSLLRGRPLSHNSTTKLDVGFYSPEAQTSINRRVPRVSLGFRARPMCYHLHS